MAESNTAANVQSDQPVQDSQPMSDQPDQQPDLDSNNQSFGFNDFYVKLLEKLTDKLSANVADLRKDYDAMLSVAIKKDYDANYYKRRATLLKRRVNSLKRKHNDFEDSDESE